MVKEFSNNAKEASNDLSALTRDFQEFAIKSANAILKVYVAFRALHFVIPKLSSAIKESIAYASEGAEMAGLVKQTGLASEKFQSLANAAKRYGGTAQATSSSMNGLRKNLEDLQKGGDGNGLKETLKAFDINANGIKSTDQMLEVIAGRMATLGSDAEKLDFGRALGLDDATIQVVGNLKEELANASQYNVFSPEDLQRSQELSAILGDLSMGFQKIFGNIAQLLLPILVPLFSGIKVIVDFFARNSEMVKSMIIEISAVIGGALVSSLISAATAVWGVLAPILLIIAGVGLIIAAFVGLNYIIGEFIAWINGEDSIFSGWLGDFETFKEGLSSGFQQIGQNIVNFFVGMGQAIKSGFMAVVGFVQSIVDKVMSFIPEWLLSFIKGGGTIGQAINAVSKGKEMLAGNKNATAANGIGYVPFDGYLAELHKGESVLDKSDASVWRDLQLGKDAISATANVPLASVPQGAISSAYGDSNSSNSFSFGDITIQTAATDAEGIAGDLMQSIKMAFNGLDTGVRA